MSVLDIIASVGHENVSIRQDRKTGLFCIIAVHDTTLGPSLGGCRMYKYDSVEDAAKDVIGLSEAMTYKNSLAGLNLGGGKSVIIADHRMTEGRDALFESFGQCVQDLKGSYIVAEDMGTSVQDMAHVMKTCQHVTGRPPEQGGGGDPSPYTALGVFHGMRACLERRFGSADFTGRHVAIQGVGHVGYILGELLAKAGAKLTVCDVNEAQLKKASSELGAEVVGLDEIYSVKCDIYAPCAFGGVINHENIPKFNCEIVAGAANVQAEAEGKGANKALFERGIMYAPDFAINSGGVILCYDELEPGGFTESRVLERVDRIYDTIGRILDESKASGVIPSRIAVKLAKDRIEKARGG